MSAEEDEVSPSRPRGDGALTSREHAELALRLLTQGGDDVGPAVDHARAAAGGAAAPDQSDFVRLAASTGRLALASGDHETAALLLCAAIDLDTGGDLLERARLLLDLARADEGCGRIVEARDSFADVIRLADAAGDTDLVVDAAVRSAFPADWRAGDRRTAAALALAERSVGDGPRAAAVLAARAAVEMRIPASASEDPQIAWVTRAEVAQPLAERALAMTDGAATGDRLIALAAWRSTHRAPDHLERRLSVSREAIDLAQRLIDHDRLVDAAAWLAVDQTEAGDRAGRDRALATLRWAAETDGNPRLRWWAATTSAGSALLAGDVDEVARHRADAVRIGRDHDLPGWVPAELLLGAATAIAVDDPDEMRGYLVPDTPVLTSPIARASVAYMAARVGEVDLAQEHALISSRAFDEESSYLLCLTLLARSAHESGDRALAAATAERLGPWAGRIATDASGWWCAGPVDLALAELALVGGDTTAAVAHLERAEVQIGALGDVDAASRAAHLREGLAAPPAQRRGAARVPGIDLLTERERLVLALIAAGETNGAIAQRLSFSASTIRADTVSIYRKLGVRGRAEAAALAVSAGLADPVG